MKLISHPFSPYGRKVKITALMKGVDGDITVEQADTNKPVNEELRRAEPAVQDPGADPRQRPADLRQPRHLRVSRQPEAFAGAVSEERHGALGGH